MVAKYTYRCIIVLALLALCWKKVRMDVGYDATLGDDDMAEELAKLFVVPRETAHWPISDDVK
jgi:hypothetical protein